MSFVGDVDIYKKMVSKEIVHEPCTIGESATEYIMLPKCDHIEETLVRPQYLRNLNIQRVWNLRIVINCSCFIYRSLARK